MCQAVHYTVTLQSEQKRTFPFLHDLAIYWGRQWNNYTNVQWIYVECHLFSSVQSSHSVVSLCDSMNCSMPGLPVHHQLPEFTQTHVHWVGDAMLSSHPLLSPSSALDLSQHQGLFQWVSSLHRWPKYWSFSFNISPYNTLSNKYKVCVFIIQSYLTLCDPMDCTLPYSSVHRILQARITGVGSHSLLQGFSWPRYWTRVSCFVGIFFTIWATKEAQ